MDRASAVRRATRGGRGGWTVLPGDPLRPGATVLDAWAGGTGGMGGVTFTVGSGTADAMWLVLLDAADGGVVGEIPFPEAYRCGDVFTMTVAGLDPDAVHYAFRAGHGGRRGPLLLDPYARGLAGGETWGERRGRALRYRCRAVRPGRFDWQGVARPRIAPEDLVVYELHVRGFTRHPSSSVTAPGTFAGLLEKLPDLLDLGVNCVELMPIFEFDETDNPFTDPATGAPLLNCWGYHPVALFAPKAAYAAHAYGDGPERELKTLVRELHRHGVEVILDVVLNHTAEGNELGPTLSLRGLDDAASYLHAPDGSYRNLAHTGNTVNANHPRTRALLLDCLRHWACAYQIDGFRFDMAAILARGTDGEPLADPPLLEAIAHDPVLADRRLIAEPFDADGLDLVGRFPPYGRWQEWNPRFMYAVRRYLTGAEDSPTELAARLAGSPDLYPGRPATTSVNYVATHDGFTLTDWTSYDRPHNEANGESGLDGPPDNASWNAGYEGPAPSTHPAIRRLRARLIRGALLLLLTARGTPMLTAGDERGRTQRGNNNAYSQDNEVSWLNWSPDSGDPALRPFVRACLAFRAAHPVLRHAEHPAAREPDAPEATGPLTLLLHQQGDGSGRGDTVFIAANNRPDERKITLPPPPSGTHWRLFADTGAAPGQDVHHPDGPPGPTVEAVLPLAGRAVAVLTALPTPPHDHEHDDAENEE